MISALLLAAAALAADPVKDQISEDITVRGKASGPALALPRPAASKPIIDEVLSSLPLGRGEGPRPETVRMAPETSRLEKPFPEPPFLALSPENIHALYDSWTFDVLSRGGEIVSRAEGVGRLHESVDWDGAGPDGRLEIAAGRSYRYRFTGRRGRRTFVVESAPVTLKSFTRREYAGETRLEVALEEIFADASAAFAAGAERYLGAMADALRAGDARPDGSHKFELYQKEPRGKLAAARAKALAARLAAALHADPAHVKIAVLPAERGAALAAFAPPAKGERLGNE